MSLEKEILEATAGFEVTQGDHAGEPFRILPWQKEFILRVFGDPDVDTAGLTLGRGNGKTTFLGLIAALAIDGPLQKPRADVVVVASSFQQATILFRHTLAFVGKRDHLRIIQNSQVSSIENANSGVILKVISSDPNRAHGLAPSLVIGDEPAQWKEGSGDAMQAAIITSLGKIPDGKIILVGTKAADEHHFFNTFLEDCDFKMEFSVGRDSDISKQRTWLDANPSMSYFPTLKKRLKKEYKQAIHNSHNMQMFKALRLNMGLSDVCENLVLDLDAWKLCLVKNLPDREGDLILGLDFGGSTSMSAAAAFWPATGRLETICFFPSNPSLKDRARSDGVGKLYEKMQTRGELELLDGRVVPLTQMLKRILEKFGKPAVFVSDRFRRSEFLDGLDEVKAPKSASVVFRGLGFRDGHEDLISFRKAVLEEKVKTLNSLSMTSALNIARVISDSAANIKTTRASAGRRKSRGRDDVLMASILAVAVGYRRSQDKKQKPKLLGVI